MNLLKLFPVLVMATFSTSGFSAPLSPKAEGLRLIEATPGNTFWATPSQIAEISARVHQEGRCGGFFDLTDAPPSTAFAPLAPSLLGLGGRDPKEQSKVQPLLKQADEGNLIAIVTKLSSYDNRNYKTAEGVAAANWIKSEYERIAAGRSDIRVELVNNTFKQPSVIATIEGSGSNKNEIVVIGGHLDSISYGKAPGADDNASGTATVMETFRILVESGYQPSRTLQFMGYAGEEEGLLGSQNIANQYRTAKKLVVGALQFDMTMYPGSTPRVTFITDYVNRELTTFTEKLLDEYVKVNWVEDKCGYACSDHASWTRAGYPSTFPFESTFHDHNPDIHTPRDTLKNLDADHGLSYLKLALAFSVEMAEATGAMDAPQSDDDTRTSSGSTWPASISRR